MSGRRRLVVPEVVQTSGMDCGPAALKCLLEGYGVSASYGRLREACQTDVDGTSIDSLEDVAVALGFDAVQTVVPQDHLLLPEAGMLPAIVVLRRPGGVLHFVIVWRCHRGLVQVMDPGVGRRWTTRARLLEELYVHTLPVPAAQWRTWAGSDAFLRPLRSRLAAIGAGRRQIDQAVDAALADPGWLSLAALDAATRMGAAVRAAGGIAGRDAAALVVRAFDGGRSDGGPGSIPDAYWSALPCSDDARDSLLVRGAVLVSAGEHAPVPEPASLPAELALALTEPPSRPLRALLEQLRADGLLRPAALAAAALTTAAGLVAEGLLFRGLIDGAFDAGSSGTLVAALIALIAGLLVLELVIAAQALRLGRDLEVGLRRRFHARIARLPDRYFRSRPVSDMAERAHTVHRLRELPALGARFVQAVAEVVLVASAIAILDPASAPAALASAALALGIAAAVQVPLGERDLRFRNHTGALGRFHLDALLGLVPLRAHSAEPAVRREHEGRLDEWRRAGAAVVRVSVAADALQTIAGFALAVWIVADYLPRSEGPGTALLLLFWALSLPLRGQEIGQLARSYPLHRNVALRFLEPLGARDEHGDHPPAAEPDAVETAGVALTLESVSVVSGGHTILEQVDLAIDPGSHVAIVGASGAGKSSLIGLLLGWHVSVTGRVLADGVELAGARLERLRRESVWIDPTVQLWNRALRDNLRYGAEDAAADLSAAIAGAELAGVVAALPDGLDTALGEGGGLVSGGEGQRVRVGRALLRPGVRLALLDEPFRGLDHEQRRRLMDRLRREWRDQTLLCATHDVAQTAAFDRVLVIDRGRVVEDGPPAALAADAQSRYCELLDADQTVRDEVFGESGWRRLRLQDGRVVEGAPA